MDTLFLLFIMFFVGTLTIPVYGIPHSRPAPLPVNTLRQNIIADSIQSTFKIPQCNNRSIRETRLLNTCTIANHLDTFTRWIAGIETSSVLMVDQLTKRYNTLISDTLRNIDTTGIYRQGAPSSPVSVVMYVSATCPLCKYVVAVLDSAVSKGGVLYNKANIRVKPFTTTFGDRVFACLIDSRKSWEFFLALGKIKERPNDSIIMSILAQQGIDTNTIKSRASSPAIMEKNALWRAEGIRNGVLYTPAIFINRTAYHSYKDPQWVIDAIEYAYEMTLSKKQ